MGLFSFLRKKTDKKCDVEPESPKNDTNKTNEVYTVLKILTEKSVGGVIKDNHIFYQKQNLNLSVSIANVKQHNQAYSAQLIFICTHPFFDEELIESSAGVGKTRENAIKNSAENFDISVLTFLLAALDCTGENTLETELMGKKHIFRVPCLHGTLCAGSKINDQANLWKIICNEIPNYLGTKKAYWIKLFAACVGNNPFCEVRINNRVCPELTKKLTDYADKWSDKENYHSEKEFILLIQDDSTYEECPYTKEQVKTLTINAIQKLTNIDSEESKTKVYNEIVNSAPIPSLGEEICALTSEILFHTLSKIPKSSEVIPLNSRNNQPFEKLNNTQLRSYGYIEDAIYDYLSKHKLTDNEFNRIIRLSSSFNAVNKALSAGSEPDDLILGPVAFFVDDNYVIW